jgi:hypothetical protein
MDIPFAFTPTQILTPKHVDLIALPPAAQAPYITFDIQANVIQAWSEGGKTASLYLNKSGRDEGFDIYDTFAERFCDDCEYHFDEKEESDTDEDGNRTSTTTTSKCRAVRAGLRDVFRGTDACPEGNRLNEACPEHATITITLPKILYDYNVADQSMCVGMVNWEWIDGQIHACEATGMLNVGDCFDVVCWGSGNNKPPFHSVITAFTASEFNEDLLTRDNFKEMCSDVEDEELAAPSNPDIILRTPESPADAVLYGPENEEASLMFLASGMDINALPGKILPLVLHTHQGILGYITPPIPAIGNRCWFITHATYEVLGQIPFPLPDPCPKHLSAAPC